MTETEAKTQAQTLVEYMGENRPEGDDKALQDQIKNLFRVQECPYFIAWGKAEDTETGEEVDIVEEADLLLADNSVVHIEAEDGGQRLNATGCEAQNVIRFIHNAVRSEVACRASGNWFEGRWQDAMSKIGPAWMEQCRAEQQEQTKAA